MKFVIICVNLVAHMHKYIIIPFFSAVKMMRMIAIIIATLDSIAPATNRAWLVVVSRTPATRLHIF